MTLNNKLCCSWLNVTCTVTMRHDSTKMNLLLDKIQMTDRVLGLVIGLVIKRIEISGIEISSAILFVYVCLGRFA